MSATSRAPHPSHPAAGRRGALPTEFVRDSLGSAPAARRALAAAGLRWIRRATPHADLYVLARSAAAAQLPKLPDAAERAITANLAWLGAPAPGPRLRLFFVGSRAEMRPLTGGTPGGWAEVAEGTAFFVANSSAPAALRHETMHLLSWRYWGTPGGPWLSEGVATLAAPRCGGHALADLAAALDRAGRLVSFDTLRRGFVTGGDVGLVHYLESADVAAYVDHVYGRAGLRALWAGGLRGAPRAIGVTADTLEAHWRADVARRTPTASWNTMHRAVEARGCE